MRNYLSMNTPLLDIQQLSIAFSTENGPVNAVNEISLAVHPGEAVALVGESGCGKSITAFSTIRLLPEGNCTFTADRLQFDGIDVLRCSEQQLRKIRGPGIGFIFQDALAALDPVFRIGDQLVEAILAHQNISREEAEKIAVKRLTEVEIADPAERMRDYPHQLSGGMRQRVMIAMALVNNPKMLIADEPTTSLDVTIQAQILYLLKKKTLDTGMSMLFITHDLGIVREITQKMIVMYAGSIVEQGRVDDVLGRPAHPYTRGLLAAVPDIEQRKSEFMTIPGRVPGLAELGRLQGCVFHPRCRHAMDICRHTPPPTFHVADDHKAACYLVEKEDRDA